MEEKDLKEFVEREGLQGALKALKGVIGTSSGTASSSASDSNISSASTTSSVPLQETRRLARLLRALMTGISGGEDNRKDVIELLEELSLRESPDTQLRDNIQAVALLAHRDRLEEKDGARRLQTETLGEVHGLCPGEPFSDYPIANPATAFLVREDLVVTLRHNLLPPYFYGLETIRVIFNFELLEKRKPESCRVEFSREEVFEVIDQYSLVDDSPNAFVALRLSRPVKGRKPVECNFGTPIGARERIYMIGHPCGLPKIHADSAIVLDASSAEGFTASLDAFAGNSGSPVFNAETGLVEGILAEGGDDFLEEAGSGCYVTNTHLPSLFFPYGVVRIQKLQRLLGP